MLREFDHSDVLLNEFGQTTTLISELSAYFREPKINCTIGNPDHDYECMVYLEKFPLIKDIYLKYNCIFQTEADVERVFSYAGIFLIDHNCVVSTE